LSYICCFDDVTFAREPELDDEKKFGLSMRLLIRNWKGIQDNDSLNETLQFFSMPEVYKFVDAATLCFQYCLRIGAQEESCLPVPTRCATVTASKRWSVENWMILYMPVLPDAQEMLPGPSAAIAQRKRVVSARPGGMDCS